MCKFNNKTAYIVSFWYAILAFLINLIML
jgi:hypothetical protein